MKKALMYLLLTLGICVGVAMVGGALVGFIAGFIDGWNGSDVGTTDAVSLAGFASIGILAALCLVLNWVFLRWGFANYGLGRVPRGEWWRMMPLLVVVMAGFAVLYALMFNPLAETDNASLTTSDENVRAVYLWMKSNPWLSLPLLALVEATANLILYGGMLREILEWKHRPEVVIPIWGVVIGLLTGISYFTGAGAVLLMIPAMLIAQFEAWLYEYTRSVVPIVVGDVCFWAFYLLLMGPALSGWLFLVAALLLVAPVYILLKRLERFKPID